MTNEAVFMITRSVWFSFKWELSEIESVPLCLCETAPTGTNLFTNFQWDVSSNSLALLSSSSSISAQHIFKWITGLYVNTGQNKVLIPLKDSDTLFSHTFQRCEQQQFLPRMMQFRSCPAFTKVQGQLRPELGPKQLQYLRSVRNTG